MQYGVAPLLAPLFDFVPNAALGGLPAGLPNITSGQCFTLVIGTLFCVLGTAVRVALQ